MKYVRKDISGKRFGKLTVKEYAYTNRDGKACWLCVCDCGNEKVFSGKSLRLGIATSCGCGRKTHGLSNTKLYNIWVSMKQRCLNPNNSRWKDYGGRGINICNEWAKSFQSFYEWAMSNGYKEGLSIERIDNNIDYSPENCTWITIQEQQRNTRKTVNLEYKGITKCVEQWARTLGIPPTTIRTKIKKGMTLYDFIGENYEVQI